MRLSVNVWTPELNILHDTEAAHGLDFKQYLVHHDPDDLMEESKNAWRCIGKFSPSSISQVMVTSFRCRSSANSVTFRTIMGHYMFATYSLKKGNPCVEFSLVIN